MLFYSVFLDLSVIWRTYFQLFVRQKQRRKFGIVGTNDGEAVYGVFKTFELYKRMRLLHQQEDICDGSVPWKKRYEVLLVRIVRQISDVYNFGYLELFDFPHIKVIIKFE